VDKPENETKTSDYFPVLRDRGGRDRVGGGDGRPTGCDGIKRNRIRNPARTK
jgi:hypothetical protein